MICSKNASPEPCDFGERSSYHGAEAGQEDFSSGCDAMNEETKRALLAAARAAVKAKLSRSAPPEFDVADGILRAQRGVFVSVHVAGELRGCIGVVLPTTPLIDSVVRCAVSAATGDTRFPPLRAEELPRAVFEISVLTPPSDVQSHEQIVVGVHGLIIRDGARTGLLLPQVATEHGMTREEVLDAVCVKAGLPEGAWKREGVRLQMFSADVFSEQPAAP